MDYTQPDLFGGATDPLAVAEPKPRPQGVTWEQIKPSPNGPCAHCSLVAEAQAHAGERTDPVRHAGWRRYGAFGCTLLLCAGHRRLLLGDDQPAKII